MKDFAKAYFNLLNGKYAGINLTRINEFDDFYNKQIIDSILPSNESSFFREKLLDQKLHVDVGFGGGFPILPLAKQFPEVQFIGVETRAKKVNVVTEIASELQLKNVKLVHSRIENFEFDRPATVSFKAVGKVNDFLKKIYTKKKLSVFFYKGPNFYTVEKEQINLAKSAWNLVEEREINVQDVDKRYIIGFENKNVPCGTLPKEKHIKLSEML